MSSDVPVMIFDYFLGASDESETSQSFARPSDIYLPTPFHLFILAESISNGGPLSSSLFPSPSLDQKIWRISVLTRLGSKSRLDLPHLAYAASVVENMPEEGEEELSLKEEYAVEVLTQLLEFATEANSQRSRQELPEWERVLTKIASARIVRAQWSARYSIPLSLKKSHSLSLF